MPYLFFYISGVAIWLLLGICMRFRPVRPASLIIGIVTAAISLIYEIVLGEYFQLYHYITPYLSIYYIVLAGFFIYPPSNIIYTMFLPKSIHSAAVYTIIWIAVMMLFEYASVKAGTVVFTGWNPFPWSPFTYIATYFWINLLYRYLMKHHFAKSTV